MRILKLYLISAIFAFVILVMISLVSAILLPPHNSWGTVSINGNSASDGIAVEGYINGIKYGETTTINGWYSVDVLADDADTAEKEGGIAGEEIILKVDGINAGNSLWDAGTHRLDLSTGSDSGTDESNSDGSSSSNSESSGGGGGGGSSGSSSGGGGGGGSSGGNLVENAKEPGTGINEETKETETSKITGFVAKEIEGSTSAVVLIIVSIVLAVVLVGLLVAIRRRRK